MATRSDGLWVVSPTGTGTTTTTTTSTTLPTSTTTAPPLLFTPTPRVDFELDTPASTVRWQVDLAHDDSTDGSGYHTHPQIPWTESRSGSFSIEQPTGHDDSDIWWEVTVEADGRVERYRVDGVTLTWTPITGPGPTTTTTTSTSTTSTTTSTTSTSTTQPGGPPEISFVSGNASPASRDFAFVRRLEDRGYEVTIHDDDDVTAAAVDGTLVVISSSVAPAVARPFARAIDEAVVTWEPNIAVELGLSAGPSWKARDQEIAGSTVQVVASHPVVAGLGTSFSPVSVSGGPWSTVLVDSVTGTVVAVAGGDTTKAVVIADDSPRRVMLPWSYETQHRITAAGWKLFEQAVTWAAG